MTGDHSLDDFLGTEGSESTATDPQAESGDADEDEPNPSGDEPAPGTEPDSESTEPEPEPTEPAGDERGRDSHDVDPAEPTYDWSPDGGECAGCGGQVSTRWRQDGEYVCPDCKEW
ncbi:DUF7573 domain-containing protein [Halorarum halobium]|uniref:DUF7573 domain-containing protein n=1 Tax=Halorarum halobium TaxID=3075121 RepID=UPI0028A648E2|nr:hypothetical protein [Halobaculum sp. XH14]